MSQDPKPVDLSNVSTDDLVEEIERRYDDCVVVCSKKNNDRHEGMTYINGSAQEINRILEQVSQQLAKPMEPIRYAPAQDTEDENEDEDED